MKKFKIFITTNPVKVFFTLLVINFIWVFSIGIFFVALGSNIGQGVSHLTSQLISKNLILMPFVVFVEEILFRWLPMILLFAAYYGLQKMFPNNMNISLKTKVYIVLFVGVVSSCVFGFLHGGYVNIPLQGFSGMAFFLFYLRILWGSQHRTNKFHLKPLMLASLLHLSSNLLFLSIQLL